VAGDAPGPAALERGDQRALAVPPSVHDAVADGFGCRVGGCPRVPLPLLLLVPPPDPVVGDRGDPLAVESVPS
jgi:hypothetical protein